MLMLPRKLTIAPEFRTKQTIVSSSIHYFRSKYPHYNLFRAAILHEQLVVLRMGSTVKLFRLDPLFR